MRRGIGRARLCDVAPCPERWPCSIHGTRSVGNYEHLGVHAGAFFLVPHNGVAEVVACDACGFGLCACAGEVLPDGWTKGDLHMTVILSELYNHVSGAAVWFWNNGGGPWWYARPGYGVNANKATRAEAMAAALSKEPALAEWALLA